MAIRRWRWRQPATRLRSVKLLIVPWREPRSAAYPAAIPRCSLPSAEGKLAAAKALIDAGAKCDVAEGPQHLTLLMAIATQSPPERRIVQVMQVVGPVDLAQELVQHKADVNALSAKGVTALMIAAAHDNAPMIGVLMRAAQSRSSSQKKDRPPWISRNRMATIPPPERCSCCSSAGGDSDHRAGEVDVCWSVHATWTERSAWHRRAVAPIGHVRDPSPRRQTQPAGMRCGCTGSAAPTGKTPLEVVQMLPKALSRIRSPTRTTRSPQGHELFMSYSCSGCHGGTGGGGMCPQLNGDVWFYGIEDDTLFRLVTLGSLDMEKAGFAHLGGPGLQMPPFGTLIKSDEELWKILTWVRSIYKGDPEEEVLVMIRAAVRTLRDARRRGSRQPCVDRSAADQSVNIVYLSKSTTHPRAAPCSTLWIADYGLQGAQFGVQEINGTAAFSANNTSSSRSVVPLDGDVSAAAKEALAAGHLLDRRRPDGDGPAGGWPTCRKPARGASSMRAPAMTHCGRTTAGTMCFTCCPTGRCGPMPWPVPGAEELETLVLHHGRGAGRSGLAAAIEARGLESARSIVAQKRYELRRPPSSQPGRADPERIPH